MRAFAMTGFEEPPKVVEMPTPEPGPGEVLVRVRAASLNGYDANVAGGMLKGMMEYRFPLVLGKDFAGTVEAVGPGASRFAAGDPVFGLVNHPSWLNTRSFAEFVVLPEDSAITRIPSGVDVAAAGALGLAGVTALQSVEAVAPQPGEAVLIAGATGGVGAFAVQLAATGGAEVIATAKPGEAADFVRGLGASHVVDYTGDLAAQVRAIRPDGVAAVLHFAGDGLALADLLVPGGRFASTFGVGPDQLAGRDLRATAILNAPEPAALDRLAAAAAGRLRVPIQRTYTLDQLGQALNDFAAVGTRGKLAISV